MIKKLIDSYYSLISLFKKEASIAIIASIIGALSEAYAIYIMVGIITKIKSRSHIDFDNNLSSNILYSTSDKYSLLIFIILAIASSILYFISQRYVIKIKSLVERYIRSTTTDAMMKMDWLHFIKLNQGDISKSIIAEGQQIAEGCMYVISGVTYLCISITYLSVSFFVVRDSLIILLIYSIFAINIYQRFAKRAERLGRNLSSITSTIGESSSAIFNNLKYIRINNLNNQAKKDSYGLFKEFAEVYENAMTSSYLTKGIMQILSSLFILVVLIYIIYTNSSNYSLILSLALFIRMAPNIYNLQYRFLDATALISWPKTYRERIKLANNYKEIKTKSYSQILEISGDIKFNSVYFSYPESPQVINGLDLTIKENQMVSILGKSGAGKSTISDLITALIKPSEGSISIGEKPLSSINVNSWRSRIGIVMQDNYLANESIAYNIALGEDNLNEEKVIDCLKLANAWGFVKNLPNGINESVMERGYRFSGGQRQRIVLARALYRNPKLLILDEPTSALDDKSEEIMISTLKNLKGKLTILIITHKIKLAKESDMIYIIENGRISKKGIWKELFS